MVPPPLAIQVTVELKFPVPETEAVHWLVCPEMMAVGLQLTPTSVIVEVVLPPLPPHATDSKRQPTAARIPKNRTLSPLLDLGDIDALGNHGGKIRTAVKAAGVSARGKRILTSQQRRTMAPTLLGRDRLLHRLEIGPEQLLQVRLEGSVPCHAEDVAVRETNSRTTCPVGTWISCVT